MQKKKKYNYHRDLRHKRDPHPADINEQFEGIARQFDDTAALNEIVRFREKKLFGEVYVYNEDRIVAQVHFKEGGVPDAKVYKYAPFKEGSQRVLSMGTIKNDLVDFRNNAEE